MKNKSKNHVLSDPDIGRLLLKLSAPATVGMIIMALYNVVDAIFVGRGIGPMAIAGLAIVFPIQMLIMGFGHLLGMGGASLVSRSIGAGNLTIANKTYGNMILCNIFIGVAITVIGVIFIDPLLLLFGANQEVLPYARDYMSVIILNAPVFIYLISSNNILRSEGKAKIAMGSMLVSALTNIILDPIFIFVLHMGIKGAAIATVIAQITTSIYIILYMQSKFSTIHIRLSCLRFDLTILSEITKIGISAFFRQIATSILMVVSNNLLKIYGGSSYIAIMGIINRTVMFSIMPLFGIAQGLQPIVGFNFGANKFHLALETLKKATLYSTLIASIGFIVFISVPRLLMSIFTNDDYLITNGANAMRLMVLALPVIGYQINGAMFFQAIGKALPAFILTTSRQILFLIPLMILLPMKFNLTGIWIAFPLSDLLSASVTFFFLRKQVTLLRKV